MLRGVCRTRIAASFTWPTQRDFSQWTGWCKAGCVRYQKTYFDVRVFNPLAPSNGNQQPATIFHKHEQEKKRAYKQRILDVEQSTFTPLVLSATGGHGERGNHLLQAPCSNPVAIMGNPIYSKTLCWLRCHLSYSLIRSAIQAIRGARSSQGHAASSPLPTDHITTEAHISPDQEQ